VLAATHPRHLDPRTGTNCQSPFAATEAVTGHACALQGLPAGRLPKLGTFRSEAISHRSTLGAVDTATVTARDGAACSKAPDPPDPRFSRRTIVPVQTVSFWCRQPARLCALKGTLGSLVFGDLCFISPPAAAAQNPAVTVISPRDCEMRMGAFAPAGLFAPTR